MNGSSVEFDWDEANIAHLFRHTVTPQEAEQVVLNDPVDLGWEIVENKDRYSTSARQKVDVFFWL